MLPDMTTTGMLLEVSVSQKKINKFKKPSDFNYIVYSPIVFQLFKNGSFIFKTPIIYISIVYIKS